MRTRSCNPTVEGELARLDANQRELADRLDDVDRILARLDLTPAISPRENGGGSPEERMSYLASRVPGPLRDALRKLDLLTFGDPDNPRLYVFHNALTAHLTWWELYDLIGQGQGLGLVKVSHSDPRPATAFVLSITESGYKYLGHLKTMCAEERLAEAQPRTCHERRD